MLTMKRALAVFSLIATLMIFAGNTAEAACRVKIVNNSSVQLNINLHLFNPSQMIFGIVVPPNTTLNVPVVCDSDLYFAQVNGFMLTTGGTYNLVTYQVQLNGNCITAWDIP